MRIFCVSWKSSTVEEDLCEALAWVGIARATM